MRRNDHFITQGGTKVKLLKRIDEGFFRWFCSLLFAAVAAVCLSAMFDYPYESTGFMISVIFESILFLLAAVGCLCGARRVGILLLFPLVQHILLIIAQGVLPGLHNVFFCGAYVCTIRLFLAVRKKQDVRDGLFIPFLCVGAVLFHLFLTLLLRGFFPAGWLLECLALSSLLLWRLRMTLGRAPGAAAAPAAAPEEAPREARFSIPVNFSICKGPSDPASYTIDIPSLVEDILMYRRRQAALDKRKLLGGACSPVLSTDKMLLAFEQAEWERANKKTPWSTYSPMPEPKDYAQATLVDLVRLYVLGNKKGIADAVDADRRTCLANEKNEEA